MTLDQDILTGKFSIKGGFQSQDNYSTQNLHQALDYTQQPLSNFTMSLNGRPVLLTGIISSSTYENNVVAYSAVQCPDGQIALRVSFGNSVTYTQGQSPVDAAGVSVLPANPNRKYACLVNTSTGGQVISLEFGVVGVIYSGITIYPQGSYELGEAFGNNSLLAIFAISSAAGGRISVSEAV